MLGGGGCSVLLIISQENNIYFTSGKPKYAGASGVGTAAIQLIR